MLSVSGLHVGLIAAAVLLLAQLARAGRGASEVVVVVLTGAYVLMIGVGLESCTAMHHPEEVIAPDLYLKPLEQAEIYTLHDRNGQTIPFVLRPHRRIRRDFPKYAPILAGMSQMHSGTLSGVEWTMIRLSDLLREVFARLTARADFNLLNPADAPSASATASNAPFSHTTPSR